MATWLFDRLVSGADWTFDRLVDLTGAGVPNATGVGTVQDGAALVITGTGFSASGNKAFLIQEGVILELGVASEGTTSVTTLALDTSGIYITKPAQVWVQTSGGVDSNLITVAILPKAGENAWLVDQEFLGDASSRADSTPPLSIGDEIRVKNVVGGTIAGVLATGQGAFVVDSSITSKQYAVHDGSRIGDYATVNWSNPATTAQVPNVVAQTLEAATALIEAAGLVVAVVARVVSPSIAFGSVAAQFPAPFQSIILGGTVELTLSDGNGRVLVPNMIGMSEDEATAARLAAGLVGIDYATIDGLNSGHVVNQSVAAGTEVAVGSAVDLAISSALMPNLVGINVALAVARIAAANLDYDIEGSVIVFDSGIEPNLVISQDPPADSTVTPHQTVTLTISGGAAPVWVNFREVAKFPAVIREYTRINEFYEAAVREMRTNKVWARRPLAPSTHVTPIEIDILAIPRLPPMKKGGRPL